MPWPVTHKTANDDSISRLNSRPKIPFPGNGKGNYKMPREGKGREIWGLYSRESRETGIPAHPCCNCTQLLYIWTIIHTISFSTFTVSFLFFPPTLQDSNFEIFCSFLICSKTRFRLLREVSVWERVVSFERGRSLQRKISIEDAFSQQRLFSRFRKLWKTYLMFVNICRCDYQLEKKMPDFCQKLELQQQQLRD